MKLMRRCQRCGVIALGTMLLLASACGELDEQTVRLPGDVPAQVATTTTSLPGEDFDAWPRPGDTLGVVGIAFDEELSVRSGPGTGEPEVATLSPLTDVVATGEARMLPSDGLWFEITTAGTTGWANARSLLYIGATSDVTAQVEANIGRRPTAPTMLELGRIVADSVASTGEVTSRVVVVVEPTIGNSGEVTYDVIGFPDDSVFGARLRIAGQQIEGGNLPPTALRRSLVYELVSVESTALCGRGVTADGLCI